MESTSQQANFDTEFSSEYYCFSENDTKASYSKSSNNNLYSDYCNYPVARIKQLFKSKFTIEFTMSTYGWFGIGSKDIKNDGFPGYTTEGFMICVDGRLYHNKAQIASHSFNIPNIKASLICDPSIGLLEVIVNDKKYNYSVNLPKEVYFVVSVSSNNYAKLHSLIYYGNQVLTNNNSQTLALEEKVSNMEKLLLRLETKFDDFTQFVKRELKLISVNSSSNAKLASEITNLEKKISDYAIDDINDFVLDASSLKGVNLTLSEDKYTAFKSHTGHCAILGSKSYSSGTHTWTVKVLDRKSF